MSFQVSNAEYPAYFRMPTKVVAYEGAIHSLGPELAHAGARRVMIITDSGLAESAVLGQAVNSLVSSGLDYFTRVVDEPDPTIRTMDAVAAEGVQGGFDAVVGVGGGSSLDIAKGVALIMGGVGSIGAVVGVDKAAPRVAVLAAVPTTIGTGSEVSWHISVRDDERQLKLTVRSPNACPDIAILDPIAVSTLPTRIAAITAADAFTHCFESFVSNNGRWLLTDALAGGAIHAMCSNLPAYLKDPTDAIAAQEVLAASCLGGMTLSHARTGIVHQMARPLGAQCGVPHGLANAILLPRVIESTWERTKERLAELYRHLVPLERAELGSEATMSERAERTKDLIVSFFACLPIPATLTEAGVHAVPIEALTEDALQGKVAVTNPCAVSREELSEIYAACI